MKLKYSKGHNSVKNVDGVMVFVLIKYLTGFWSYLADVIGDGQTDRQTDRRTYIQTDNYGKNNMSPLIYTSIPVYM